VNNIVSIIVPAFNVEEFIAECIISIQKQTYSSWEAIIVDDGSSDKTVEVIEILIKQDKRFRLIRQPNGGVSKARNSGLLAATGKYLTFLDGDDMWEATFLSELVDTIEAKDVDMAYCGYTHLYTNGFRRKFSYPYTSGNILFDVIHGKIQVHIGAMVVKKDLIDRSGLLFTEGCLVGQDQEFIWKLVSQATVQAVAKDLMIYRIRSGSAITAKWNWKKHIHAFYGFKRATEYILVHAPQIHDKKQLSQGLHERLGYKLYKIIWRMIKNGYCEEARQLMENEEYNTYLSYLDSNQMKLVDRLKYKIVCSKEGVWWKIAKLL
jgi:glycosyltransferase involved in cell wall biosynthesis